MDDPVYMDHNATTALRPEAGAAMTAALRLTGNSSSVHGPGRAVKRVIEDARDAVAALVGAEPGNVIFTSGATEANNLALKGFGRERVLATAVEHASVLAACDDVELIPVDGDGIVDLAALSDMLNADDRPALVAVMLANNETGVIQPVADAAAIAREAGALVHCDAVQAAGKMEIDFTALGVHSLALSAHKLGGPQGAGTLIADGEIMLSPEIRGGGQERRVRAGTENVPGIAGFGAAAEAARAGLTEFRGLGALRDRIEAALAGDGAVVFAAGADRLCNTSCLAMPGTDAQVQLIKFDLAGIAVTTGAACSSGKVEASHVLAAMGIAPGDAKCAIRISLGWNSEPAHADRFIEAWCGIRRARSEAAA